MTATLEADARWAGLMSAYLGLGMFPDGMSADERLLLRLDLIREIQVIERLHETSS